MEENNTGNSGNQTSSPQSTQRPGGDEALEGNTGAGGGSLDQGGDSDGNTGVMSNDELENEPETRESSTESEDTGGAQGGQ